MDTSLFLALLKQFKVGTLFLVRVLDIPSANVEMIQDCLNEEELRRRDFTTTHWSVVLRAGQDPSSSSQAALEQLCQTYWYPLYAYIRSRGYDAHEAQDLVQAFFSDLLARNSLRRVNAGKGKFRSFLLACLTNFLANEWERNRAQKRGGGATHVPIDPVDPEARYQRELTDNVTPETLYQRRWAEALLRRVLDRLKAEVEREGSEERFGVLKAFLVDDKKTISVAEASRVLQTTEAATKALVYRLRKRYREIFLEEIGNTTSGPKEMEEEIRELITALRN